MDHSTDNRNIRILLVAPYIGLIKTFETAVSKRENMSLESYESDTVNAPALIRTLDLNNYDIIISRGFTARIIEETSGRQVLNVGISIYDALKVLQLAKNYIGKMAIVGFPSIIHYAIILKDILQYDIDIFTLSAVEELPDKLEELKGMGYTMVIGDVITTKFAKSAGLQSILITTSMESVEQTLDSAEEICRTKFQFSRKAAFLETILSSISQNTVVYTPDKKIVYSNVTVLPALAKAFNNLITFLDARSDQTSSVKTIDDFRYTIHGRKINFENCQYYLFSYSRVAKINKEEYFIKYCNPDDSPEISQRIFFALSPASKNILNTLESFKFLSRPVLISGPMESGKDQFALYLNEISNKNRTPMAIIDCKYATDKLWANFINSDSSPIYENGFILYFKNMHLLKDSQQETLVSMIHQINLHHRNQLIFSYIPKVSRDFDNGILLDEIVNSLQPFILKIPSLSERKEDIPNLITLYLSEFNSQLDRQVIGFEPEAMKIMKNYSWPGNLNQLKNVIQELVLTSKSLMITPEEVNTVLQQSDEAAIMDNSGHGIRLDGSLDDITRRVVRQVVAEEGGNQSRAARRLQIGRSTLRRHLE